MLSSCVRALSSAICLSLVSFLVVVSGCAATSARQCQIGADCPSGACGADGRCLSSTTASSGQGGEASTSSEGGSGGSGASPASGGSGGSSWCSPNGDGVITEVEVPLVVGASVKLRVAQDVQVDTSGTPLGDGQRKWDFATELPGDHMTLVQTLPLDGSWYASKFVGASYAAKLSDGEDLLGVFESAPGALLLRGVVSPQDGLMRTELLYDPPIVVLSFPLESSKSWQSAATVSGLAAGVVALYTESYDFTVDARGVAATPFGEFDVLRVHSKLVRTVGGLPITIQSHVFISECFGNVATITSKQYELSTEFSSASEIRRLAP